jgi:ribosomal-protein-alanine N-acetyltransferase
MKRPVWLERALPADAAELAALESTCFSHPWNEDHFRQEVAYGPPGAVLVVRSPASGAPGIVAYCAYRLVVDEMHVMDVAVAPGWRRCGLASWLVWFSLARAARDGARRALLEVRAGNGAARSLYARLGFAEVGRRRGYYAEPVEDAVVLCLDPIAAPQC